MYSLYGKHVDLDVVLKKVFLKKHKKVNPIFLKITRCLIFKEIKN